MIARLGWIAARIAWGGFLGIHLHALAKVFQDGRWVTAFALLLTVAFAALRTIDHRWLRLPNVRSTALVLLIATLVAHGGALELPYLTATLLIAIVLGFVSVGSNPSSVAAVASTSAAACWRAHRSSEPRAPPVFL